MVSIGYRFVVHACASKLMFTSVILSSIAAPSSPPSTVNATVESSTSIRVIWGEVPAIDRNGIITQYEVMYEPLETFGQLAARTNMTDTNSTFEILIENLQEYVQYSITVRAYTQVGEGPFSPNITFRTREAGKCRLFQNNYESHL